MADSPTTPMSDDDLEALLAEPPKWPKVIGIISIVLGALGFTCIGLQTASIFFQEQLMGLAAQGTNAPPPPTMEPTPALIGASVLGILLNVLLIAAGIATLARSPKGRTLHLVYAVVSIISSFAGSYVGIQAQQAYNADMDAYAEQYPESIFAQQHVQSAEMRPIMQLGGVAVSLVIALSWPLFCLIWFTLSKRGKSDMKGTGLEAAA